MHINCPSCKNSYNLIDSLVTEKGTAMNCPKCDSSFVTFPNGLTVLSDSSNNMDIGFSPASMCTIPAPALFDKGDTIQEGRFEMNGILGKGRYGSVYRVFDRHMEMELALKVVLIPEGSASDAVDRLSHEFKIREKTKNRSHILNGYLPILEEYKGLPLLLLPMELANQGSLRTWMVRNKDLGDRKTQALAYFSQICSGVIAIHEVGLVHLDLKPENILLVDENVKISDFNLSRDSANFGLMDMSLSWQGIGTAHYMAPEQIMAARPKDVGQAADIYALGCILCELLDGDLPYVGTAQQILEKHNRGFKPILKGVEDHLKKIIFRCIETDPSKRFRDVVQLIEFLLHKNGKDCNENIENDERVKWLQTVCDRFDMYQSASRPEENFFYKVQKWIPNALELLRWGTEMGNPEAQHKLGVLYYLGEGVEEDKVEAFRLWMQSAEHQYGPAQYNVAMCYDYGQGAPENKNQSVHWYRKAAEQGNAEAQKDLGNCYFYGEGVPEDKSEALRWYHRSASKGNSAAQCNLGYCYYNGLGVPRNESEAEKWLRKSVEQGNKDAARLLKTQ